MLEAGTVQVQDLAPEQVVRLDLGGAFVERGDARIARELLDAGLGDEAVAAVDLHGIVGRFLGQFGQQALDDRGQERDQFFAALALRFGRRMGGNIVLHVGIQGEHAAALGERFLGQQHAADIGMHDQRIGGLVGNFGPVRERICRRSRA